MSQNEEFEKTKQAAEILYQSFGEVYCPYFKEKIVFNSAGLEHLKFKSYGNARMENDQKMRFKILYIAPEILSLSRTLQGFRELRRFERMRKNNKTEKVLKAVYYYEFIAIIKNAKAKVVVKQIENGQKYFWSIVPYWKIKAGRRLFSSGNIEEE